MIKNRNIAPLTITASRIAAATITGAKIANDAIDSQHFAAGSIDNEHLADDAVGTDEIADEAVTSAKLADGLDPILQTQTVTAKTASYSVLAADMGKMFTNRGDADAITFTLPAVVAGLTGKWVEFFCIADYDFIIDGTAGELVVFNDAAANSIAFSTDTEQIGAYVKAICDGTSWLIIVGLGAETQTPTITT